MEPAVLNQESGSSRTYRGVSPEGRQAERRRRLLDSARELYGTVGFNAVSIQALCKHAGVTARHFYEAFDDREAVLEIVHDEIVEAVGAEVVLAVAAVPSSDPSAVSAAGIRAFYESVLNDPRCARIAILEVMVLPAEKAMVCVDGFGSIIEDYAAGLQRDGIIELQSVHLSSVALVGAMRQLMIDWLTSTDKPSIDELVDITHELFAHVWGFAPTDRTA